MKLFTPRKAAGSAGADDVPAAVTLEEISARLDKLERVVTDLKQNIDMIPAIVRKLYLDGVAMRGDEAFVNDPGELPAVVRSFHEGTPASPAPGTSQSRT